ATATLWHPQFGDTQLWLRIARLQPDQQYQAAQGHGQDESHAGDLQGAGGGDLGTGEGVCQRGGRIVGREFPHRGPPDPMSMGGLGIAGLPRGRPPPLLEQQEVASLYARGPTERVYETEIDDGGGTTGRFGDARGGARPPPGTPT